MHNQPIEDPYKDLKYLWDFAFGVLLIGGAPWSVIALVVVTADLLETHAHVVLPNAVGLVVFLASQLVALSVFVAAVAYRCRKRLLPKAFIAGEIFLGLVGAILLFLFYGVLLHSIVD